MFPAIIPKLLDVRFLKPLQNSRRMFKGNFLKCERETVHSDVSAILYYQKLCAYFNEGMDIHTSVFLQPGVQYRV